MYLERIMLVKTLPCLAEPGKIIVIGEPSRRLDEVIPYMAMLPNVITHNPQAGTLTLRRQQGFLTLHADRVSITQVHDVEEGLELLSHLADAVNATWTHRHELVPVSEPRRVPQLLDIWSLLPQTNCKRCDEATCMAFAVALLQHRRTLSECKVLNEDPAFADRRVTLEALIGDVASSE